MGAIREKGTGSVYKDADSGRWIARLQWRDDRGKRRQARRSFATKTEARDELHRLSRMLGDQDARMLRGEQMRFAQLCDFYEERYLVPAQFSEDGRRISGLRSLVGTKAQMLALRAFFGRQKLRSITHGDIERFKAERLATPKERGKGKAAIRAISSVNRELARLRRILNIAKRAGWIGENPFNQGEPLASQADERKRDRILTTEEEERLLSVCIGPRIHLRPLIVAALDTGCRWGELKALLWADVDFAQKVLRIRAETTKTQSERWAPMTARLERELWELSAGGTVPGGLRVFGISGDVKRSFTTARKFAKLEGFRWHDLRHTAATRMIQRGMPLMEVGRVLGHSQPGTTYRYISAGVETAQRAGRALDDFNEDQAAPAECGLVN